MLIDHDKENLTRFPHALSQMLKKKHHPLNVQNKKLLFFLLPFTGSRERFYPFTGKGFTC